MQQVGIYEEEPFHSYFSGNTIQICPVGALTSADYRFRSRPVRPGVDTVDRRARRLRLGDPRRPPSRQGHAPPRRRRPRGQRGVDHRQGPVRLHLGGAGRSHRDAARTQRQGRARAGFVARSAGDRCSRSRQGGRQGRRPAGRSADRRGCVRLQQVRPYGAQDQRHRLPRPRPFGRGGRVPRLARRRDVARRHVRLAGEGLDGRPRRLRARGRGRRGVPAPPQGIAQWRQGRRDRQPHHAWADQDGRTS